MVSQIEYVNYLSKLDIKLKKYFDEHKEFIHCKAGCSFCCEKGDYPLSEIELTYLMQGYQKLDNSLKIQVQNNIKTIQKGEHCPFLINKQCAVYSYRPIICRIHGLAYLCNDKTAKIPFCVNLNKNYSAIFSNGELLGEPILENLDKYLNIGEIRNLYNWIKSDQ